MFPLQGCHLGQRVGVVSGRISCLLKPAHLTSSSSSSSFLSAVGHFRGFQAGGLRLRPILVMILIASILLFNGFILFLLNGYLIMIASGFSCVTFAATTASSAVPRASFHRNGASGARD